jgi:predicted  nucleic acid-binding Zn-ribbon protein
MESTLVEFEDSFRNFRALSGEEKLRTVLKLVQMKEKTLHRLCTLFISYIGVDNTVSVPLSDQLSPETKELITMLTTFKSVAHALKLMQLTQTDTDTAVTVSDLHQKIADLQLDLRRQSEENDRLEVRYKAVSSDEGRQQILFRQQSTIDSLEKSNRDMSREIQKLRSENRRVMQNEAYVKDQLDQSHQRILKMKESYEKEISILRPQLQSQMHGIS